MGRLDDAAKLKVVELRKAGLSFRKIKAVLELQNIKVSAQAIYLYLREFQGRPAGRARAKAGEAGGSVASAPRGPAGAEGRTTQWNHAQLQNLLREASQQANCIVALEFAKKAPGAGPAPPGAGGAGGGGRPGQSGGGNQEEADIQIVSVTSLAQSSQQRPPLSSSARTASGAQPSNTASPRRRAPASPAFSPILAARRRLLDKALSHRAKVLAPMGAPLRRYQPGLAEDVRRDVTRDHEKYNFANDNTFLASRSGGAGDPRRGVAQRPAPSLRRPQPPPRVGGVRPPDRTPGPPAPSTPRTPLVRLQAPGGPGTARRDGGGSPPRPIEAAQRSLAAGGALPDQVLLLAAEVRGLGRAVQMLVEQQGRLEREQVQQTRVQKQILGALQGLASSLGPSPRAQPGGFACGLETVEAFELPDLGGPDADGFPPSHAYAQTQPYSGVYTQPRGAATAPCYAETSAQPCVRGSDPQFRGPHPKGTPFPGAGLVSLQTCDVAAELEGNSGGEPLNTIKVEDT